MSQNTKGRLVGAEGSTVVGVKISVGLSLQITPFHITDSNLTCADLCSQFPFRFLGIIINPVTIGNADRICPSSKFEHNEREKGSSRQGVFYSILCCVGTINILCDLQQICSSEEMSDVSTPACYECWPIVWPVFP